LPKFTLPSFNFDFSSYVDYVGDKFAALKTSFVELFVKVQEATAAAINEAQIVWNENFNGEAIKPQVVVEPPPVVIAQEVPIVETTEF